MAILAGPAGSFGADTEALAATCDGCHGPQGISTHGDIPIIAGRSPAPFQKALEQFQAMDRPCRRTAFRHGDTERPETSMCTIAAGLSDAEIENLSAYYAALEFRPAEQTFDAEKAVGGASLHGLYCESCHPAGGSEAGYAGRLAGQWRPYLERTIGQIRNAELIVPHMMERKLSDFSAEEIDLLLNFWASQQD